MKKQKIVKPFFFKNRSHQDLVDLINKDLPINLRYNEAMIKRIHDKYPFISKTEVSIIVKAVFQSFRDLLVLGNVLNFNSLFFDTKLFFFQRLRKGRIVPSMRIQIKTPPKLRKK